MSSEFDENAEPKDNTKLIWGGVVVAFLVMAAVIWMWARPPDTVSQVRFRHILVTFKPNDEADRARALELITSIRERLEKGESWSTLAKTYSDDPGTQNRGGDMGWVAKGQLDPVIESYVWEAKPHQLSDIIQSGRGFHVVEVLEVVLSKADKYERDLKQREEEKLNSEKTSAAKKAPPAPAPAPAPALATPK